MATYLVKSGDNFYNIATRFHGDKSRKAYQNELIALNNGKLNKGATIKLPSSKKDATKKVVKQHTETKPKENVVKESKSKNKCSCCIKNNLLITSNIIYKKGGSMVKKNKKVRKIKAIVLHRTAGGTTAGAVRSKIGTTFYVDGPRGNDGQIFQSFSLLKRTNHIKSSKKYRIAKYDIKSYNSIGIEVIGYAYYKKDDILYKDIQGKPKQPNNTKLSKAYSNGDGIYYWDPLSSKQINSVVCIVKALMKKYSLSKNDILMHELIQGKTSGEGQCVMDAIKAKI